MTKDERQGLISVYKGLAIVTVIASLAYFLFISETGGEFGLMINHVTGMHIF